MIKKIAIIGIANLLLGLALNAVLTFVLPGLASEYQNTSVFRPWDDPLMMTYFAYPFILGMVLGYLWDLVENKLKGRGLGKAFEFAKLYFVVATVPGMFISYTSMQISLGMILMWTVTGFLQAYIAGLVLVKVK